MEDKKSYILNTCLLFATVPFLVKTIDANTDRSYFTQKNPEVRAQVREYDSVDESRMRLYKHVATLENEIEMFDKTNAVYNERKEAIKQSRELLHEETKRLESMNNSKIEECKSLDDKFNNRLAYSFLVGSLLFMSLVYSAVKGVKRELEDND